MVIIIAIAAAAFLAGVVVGVVALVCTGIAREESDNSLRGEPTTRSAAATRRLTGLYVRMPPDVSRPGGVRSCADIWTN